MFAKHALVPGHGNLRIARKSVPETEAWHRFLRAAAGCATAIGLWGTPVSGRAATATGEPPLPLRTQVIELQQGWNAVWLEVEPLVPVADTVFAGTAVDICARFIRPVGSMDFIKDPGEQPFNEEGWGVWYAPAREDAIIKTLHLINGHAGYLIHATQAFRWSVEGKVEFRPYQWKHAAFSLVGFAVDPAGPPTFGDFFSGSDGRVGSQIYRLVAGKWQRIQGTAAMRAGEACWIYAAGDSHYQGPLTVHLTSPALDFGAIGGTASLIYSNSSTAAQLLTAEIVPAGSSVAAAANLPLARVTLDVGAMTGTASPVAGALPVLDSGLADTLRLQVQRAQMTAPRQSALLKLSDGAGCLAWIPVRASK